MSAKHNLLLGILALQNNFINRAQLLAGFNAWVEDKRQALADLLLEQKVISPAQHALLVALTAEHLRQHGDDADQSLAALSSAGSARRDLEQIADPEVQASLAPLASDDVTSSSGDRGRLSVTCTVPPPAAPDLGGRFRILRHHAAGGLGQVSVALDQELNREVALKEIKEEHSHDPEARARFLLEAEITGALEHPGIVPVYSLGSYADGRPFYAMRFIQGDSLKDGIQQFHSSPTVEEASGPGGPPPDFQSLAFRKLLGRFVDVCNAIAYAHSRGVLHRDLKPGNIMLGKYGETLVVDWGLAKAAGAWREARGERDEPTLRPGSVSGSSETLPGAALGTPAYMSPEQAAGRVDELGPASDVYSLGATLYHLLTGTVPFKGKEPLEILKKVKAGDLSGPRQVQPALAAALEAVCRKAMALKPADRYASPRELADDVERWLADEPVCAWPEPWAVKARRWTNRHRVLVTSAAACLAVASLALVTGILFVAQANADLDAESNKTKMANAELKIAYGKLAGSEKEARAAAAGEARARDRAEDLLATSTMMLAKTRFEGNQAALANDLLEQVPARFRLSPWHLLKNYLAGSLFTLRGHTGPVMTVAFAPDGVVLASGSTDNTVRLWDARTGQELRTLRGHTDRVRGVAFTPDGGVLASASYDKTIKLWDRWTGQELCTLRGHEGWVTSVAFAPDGQMLASASTDNTVRLWDPRTGQQLRILGKLRTGTWPGLPVPSLGFAADGRVLASMCAGADVWDVWVKLWDVRSGQEVRSLRGHTNMVTSVAFAPDGQMLASASLDNTVRLWDTQTGQELRTLRGHTHHYGSVAFAGDGQVLASASDDDTVKLWSTRTGEELCTLRGHLKEVNSVAFSPDGQVLASASSDNTIKLWGARPGQELYTLRAHRGSSAKVAFSGDGMMLVAASNDGTIRLFNAFSGQELRMLRGHTAPVMSVTFAPDTHMVASASKDSTIKLWDPGTGEELRTLRGHAAPVMGVVFAPDSQVLASASLDSTIKLWEARTGQELRTLRGHKGTVSSDPFKLVQIICVAFAPDGHVLASGSNDRTVKLWDTRTGKDLRTLRGHTGMVTSVAFSPDGQVLASASVDGTVKLWETPSGQELHTLPVRTNWVYSVAFAQDGHVLATASTDESIKLWDTRTGQHLRTLRGHTEAVWNVAFAPDGQVLASASRDGTVKLWDTRTGQDLGLPPESARRFRLWVTSPDFQLHRDLAEAAERNKQPFTVAFRLGRYLAATNYHASEVNQVAIRAGWPATGGSSPAWLLGLPFALSPAVRDPAFPDGIACTGVLYKYSCIAPARLLVGTAGAVRDDPSNWLNHAFHGGAFYRNGEHAKALAELTEAVRLHGTPCPLTHNLLALTHISLGHRDKAADARTEALPGKQAPWEDVMLHSLFQPEVEAAFAAERPAPKLPLYLVPGALEGERLKVLRQSGAFAVRPQNMQAFEDGKNRWSANSQLLVFAPGQKAWVDLEVPVAADGKYHLIIYLTKARDYGIIQFSLDGKPLGHPIDCFHPGRVLATGPIDLGAVELTRGTATLRGEVVGANPRSEDRRYLWGLDCLVLKAQ
jgi:WD40 repeat protein/serine/threonine protein kinase